VQLAGVGLRLTSGWAHLNPVAQTKVLRVANLETSAKSKDFAQDSTEVRIVLEGCLTRTVSVVCFDE
jgi:hypothetical protein